MHAHKPRPAPRPTKLLATLAALACLACTGAQAMTGDGEMVFDGDSYTGRMNMTMSQGAMVMKYSGKRVGDCTAPVADPTVAVPELGGRYATTTCYRGESITPGNSFPRIPTYNYEVASTGTTNQRDARARLVQGYAITGASGR